MITIQGLETDMVSDKTMQTYDSSAAELGQKISNGASAATIGNLETAVRNQANQIAAIIIEKTAPSKPG